MDSRQSDDFTEEVQAQAVAAADTGEKTEAKVRVQIKPPPKFVRTVRDLIYWEYAKLIARAAHMDNNYGFIGSRFKKLKDGTIKWKGLDADTQKQIGRTPKCEYCAAIDMPLAKDHIIPLVKGGPDMPGNIVLACKACNSSKNDYDIFEWYYVVQGKKEIPKLVYSKYLKMVWDFHVAYHMLDRADINADGQLNVLDLGAIFKRYEDKR